MENRVFTVSYVDGGISCNDLPQNIFTVSWSRKAERPFRHTHPQNFFVLSPSFFLKAQDHKEGMHSTNNHEFIQVISKAKKPISITFQTWKGPWERKRKKKWIKKASVTYIWSGSFSIHSGPLVDLKETGMMWLGDIKQVTWTFIDECSRIMQETVRRRRAKKRRLVWD